MKITIFRTLNYKWRLLTLSNGKHYIKRELTKQGFRKWMSK